ncbi:MAG: hypothetical protein LBK64_05335 [Spirochaetaceae bacterium]|jgi:chromosome segregation ATPase|nr:hypothetical protein [Spirochaetaceae bacterium]
MGFFTVGNIFTLAITVLALVLYRQIDKRTDSLGKLRKYGEKLKADLAAFVAGREAAVRDYAVELDVQQKAAKELMKRLVVTDDELAGKAEAVSKIDEKISAYDASLEELVRMTGRVQENLGRIREESVFVENSARRIGEARTKLEELEKNLGGLELRFEKENAEILEKTADAVSASVRSTVSGLQTTVENVERQVEDHRNAVSMIEQQRKASLARDIEIINKTLREAVEKAGSRADRMEEAALVKLKDQALERVKRFQTAVEEKISLCQENARARVQEVQGLVKSYKDEWKTDHNELEARQKAYRDEWKREAQELNGLAKAQKEGLKRELQELQGLIKAQEEAWRDTLAETERRILEDALRRGEEYTSLQNEQFRRVESLSDDVGGLEAELRRSMEDAENRVRSDFARFEQEAAGTRSRIASSYEASAERLREGIAGLEQELNALKSSAYENVSEKLKVFEDEFFADLAKRSGEIDRRLDEWKGELDGKLLSLGDEAGEERRSLERAFTEDLKQRFSDENTRLVSELAHLKAETGAFEEGIRDVMSETDRSITSLREQLEQDLRDARQGAENTVKSELARYELDLAEKIKQGQRDLEAAIRDMEGGVEERRAEINSLLEDSRTGVESWKAKLGVQIREAESSLEEVRRRTRELGAENDERFTATRQAIKEIQEEADARRDELFSRTEDQARVLDNAIKDADRRLREFAGQTRLFEEADALRVELNRKIEDLSGDLNRLEQRRSEAAALEGQFVKIKRLEDEVNAKMTRFLSEKRRIELMEADFNRLLQTSEAVEEKLVQVSSSDDTLQAMQVQLRKITDAIGESEDRFQRIEKKNQILEATNAGIDRNFKSLREAEESGARLDAQMKKLLGDLDEVRSSVEILSSEQAKVQEAAEQAAGLDETLKDIEGRIEAMNVAREWLAKTESRLQQISKDAQEEVKLLGALLKKEGSKGKPSGRGAPTIADRENVVRLAHQGWKREEIARALNLSLGEVELILELPQKD